MKVLLGLVLTLAIVLGGIGYCIVSSNHKTEDKQAMINAAEEGTASILAGGIPASDGYKKHFAAMIDSSATSIVDEGNNQAKVIFSMRSGAVYDSQNIECDENGVWHSTGSNGGLAQAEADFAYGTHKQ